MYGIVHPRSNESYLRYFNITGGIKVVIQVLHAEQSFSTRSPFVSLIRTEALLVPHIKAVPPRD